MAPDTSGLAEKTPGPRAWAGGYAGTTYPHQLLVYDVNWGGISADGSAGALVATAGRCFNFAAEAPFIDTRAQSSRPAEFGGRGMSFNICRGTRSAAWRCLPRSGTLRRAIVARRRVSTNLRELAARRRPARRLTISRATSSDTRAGNGRDQSGRLDNAGIGRLSWRT
jgi:hypothetical protein